MSPGDTLHMTQDGAVGRILLNRPKALNALTAEQIAAIGPMLTEWARDPSIALVLIEGMGEKAFCAGGDIRVLTDAAKTGDSQRIKDFFAAEYRLNQQIKRFPKPYVALLDGFVMGGGVGISVHGSHRIVTERTVFAMPESGIGMIPDVGGTWFLPRLPGRLGWYLGLTGHRLKAADCLWSGVGTHGLTSEGLNAFIAFLCQLTTGEVGSTEALGVRIASYLEESGSRLPVPDPAPIFERMALIDRYFSADRLADLTDRLEADQDQDPWIAKTLAELRSKSPMALAATMVQLSEGATATDFESCMEIEYRAAPHLVQRPDFAEGVRALLIDRDNAPKWSPPDPHDITDAEVSAIFADDETGGLALKVTTTPQ